MKSQSCNLKKIKKILFYDFVVQKCKSCEYIRMFSDDFELLKYQVLYSKNVGNIKKHEDLNLYSELEKKYIEDFLKCFLTKKKIIENNNEVCDICKDQLKKINVNGFVYYECNYCNSIYFLQKDFEDFVNNIIKQIYKKNNIFRIYFTLSNYYKNMKIKIKEIFHRKVKNNVIK